MSTARYDARAGTATDWEVRFEVRDALPDGLALDAEGPLWITCWGAGEVRRYDHDGRVVQVEVDAPLTTSSAFAGEDLATLVITTERDGLSPGELAAAPASGSLFVARPGVRGRSRTRWSGTLVPQPDPTA